MGLHYPFGFLKHKLRPKQGLGIKLPIWLPTTKSRELPQLIYVQVVCHILLENSWWVLQLFFRPHLNRRFSHKVMGFQSCKSPNFENFENFRLQLGSHGLKWHLGSSPVARHIEYYKGEGGGFLQVRAMMSLVNQCLLMAHPCIKNVRTMH
jgi:hypothetical protein